MKIPSHHASSHCRQNDEFVFLLSQWKTHSLPNRTLPFLQSNHDPVLYISEALDLPQRDVSETVKKKKRPREGFKLFSPPLSSSFCEKIICGKKAVNHPPTNCRLTQKENRFYCLHTLCPVFTSRFTLFISDVHVCTLHVQTTCTEKQRLPSALVFDSMLSEWLISQCFDLLQLLELCLVRAWIWHTLQIIMWLRSIQCFFCFQFSFWKDMFMLRVLQFWYHTRLFYTQMWIDFTIRHLLN